jgi:hypothetical protein
LGRRGFVKAGGYGGERACAGSLGIKRTLARDPIRQREGRYRTGGRPGTAAGNDEGRTGRASEAAAWPFKWLRQRKREAGLQWGRDDASEVQATRAGRLLRRTQGFHCEPLHRKPGGHRKKPPRLQGSGRRGRKTQADNPPAGRALTSGKAPLRACVERRGMGPAPRALPTPSRRPSIPERP